MTHIDEVARVLRRGQDALVARLTEYQPERPFQDRPWRRADLGEGRVRVLDDGAVFERAAVNVSRVAGPRVPPSITETQPHLAGAGFRATGLSVVLHPRNPYAPACHANFRYFEAGGEWWFGGGLDLTPCYGFTEDAAHFHGALRDWCARHPPADHRAWKAACDDYFRLPHRGEQRGVGGVFFNQVTGDFAACLAMVAEGVDVLCAAYLPVLDRRRDTPHGERERRWQLHRRGRYVEFNLVCDRGTRFGLQTGGDSEAVLVSLPPLASWAYQVTPEPGSPEERLSWFLQPREWTDHDLH